MPKEIGRLTKVGVGIEAVRGTAVAPQMGVKWVDLKADNKTKSERDEEAIGVISIADDSTIVERWGEIVPKMKLHDLSIGYFLLACLGAVESTAKTSPNDAVYDHEFTLANNNQHPSLTMAVKDLIEDVRFPLAMIDSMKFELEPSKGYIYVEVTMMSKESGTASNTISYVTERDFLIKNMQVKRAADISGLGAASPIALIKKFTLEIKKNLQLEYVVGSITPVDILNQAFEVTGNMVLNHTDKAFETLQLDETKQALRIDFRDPNFTIGSTSKPELVIDLNKVKFMNYETNRSPNDIVEESFDFEAFYDVGDAEQIKATLTNLQESYVAA